MTDRELTELAAKAVGVELRFVSTTSADYRTNLGELPYTIKKPYFEGWNKRAADWTTPWNPLKDDGLALRLAVKLQLSVCNEQVKCGVAYCERSSPGNEVNCLEFPQVESATKEGDEITDADYAATRRAIVMAAAQIGKQMI